MLIIFTWKVGKVSLFESLLDVGRLSWPAQSPDLLPSIVISTGCDLLSTTRFCNLMESTSKVEKVWDLFKEFIFSRF